MKHKRKKQEENRSGKVGKTMNQIDTKGATTSNKRINQNKST